MELWLSGNALVLALAAALVAAVCYLSPALAAAWNLPKVSIRSVLIAVAISVPFAVGSGRLDTFWRAITQRPVMAVALSVGLVLLIVVAALLRDLPGRLRVGAAVSLLIILAITVAPEGSFGWNAAGLSECFIYSTAPGNNWLYDAAPNVVLYAAAGLLLASLLRRTLKMVLVLAALSATIELYQGVFTDRACQVSDFAANVFGALVGVGLAVAATRLGARPQGSASSMDA